MSSGPVEIRRVRAQDWPALRALRLEALADTPIAYLETLAQAQQLPDSEWRGRALRGAAAGDSFQVLAWHGDRAVGTCVAFLRDRAAWLAAVYLAPTHRGQDLLAAMVGQCADWARAAGAPVLRLEVHEDNHRAGAAYRRLGFLDSGQRTPYPLAPGGDEVLMERPL